MQSSSPHTLLLDAQTGALITEQEFEALPSSPPRKPLFQENRISFRHHIAPDHPEGKARILDGHSIEYSEGHSLRWRQTLPLKKPANQYTYFSVPKIFSGKVFVVVGKPENTLFIFDQHTGSFQSKVSVAVSGEVNLIPVSEEVFLVASFHKLALADIQGNLLQNIAADKGVTLSTWSVDDNFLFSFFNNGVIRAWHLPSGKLQWEHTLPIKARDPLTPYSKAECFYPFVRTNEQDLLIDLLDDSRHQLIALNKTSGAGLWTSEKGYLHTFTFDGDSVFFMRDLSLHRFSLRRGTIEWMTELSPDLRTVESFHTLNGSAYIWWTDAQHVLTCQYVDSAGNILWKQTFPEFAFSRVVDPADDGIFYQTAPAITDALLKAGAAQFTLEMRTSQIEPRFR